MAAFDVKVVALTDCDVIFADRVANKSSGRGTSNDFENVDKHGLTFEK